MKNTILIISFDASQNSANLNWIFSRDGATVPMGSQIHAGAYVFQCGDRLEVQIIANCEDASTVALVDCQLIHMPLRNSSDTPDAAQIGQYPAASPFFIADDLVFGSAVLNLPASAFHIRPGSCGTHSWNLNQQMRFCHTGAWKMSFVMTVKITTRSGVSYRVFGFDPEVQVTPGL